MRCGHQLVPSGTFPYVSLATSAIALLSYSDESAGQLRRLGLALRFAGLVGVSVQLVDALAQPPGQDAGLAELPLDLRDELDPLVGVEVGQPLDRPGDELLGRRLLLARAPRARRAY